MQAMSIALRDPNWIEMDFTPLIWSHSTSAIVLIISLPIPERKAMREMDQTNNEILPVIMPPKINGIDIEDATIEFPISPCFLPQIL